MEKEMKHQEVSGRDSSGQLVRTTEPNTYCALHHVPFQEVEKRIGGWLFECPKCRMDKLVEDMERSKIRAAHAELNLPKRLKESTFDNYKPLTKGAKEALETCRKLVQEWPESGGGLMLGGVGTGKTHLAAATCQALCNEGISCQMTTVNKLVRDVRAPWGQKDPDVTEDSVIAKYANCGLLVLDEVGTNYGTDSEKVIINDIINSRYEMQKPTIVIGNLSVSEATEALGERVIDRLRHDGFMLFFDWQSYRTQNQQGDLAA